MNLDQQLKQWRDATESLAPSDAVLAALRATVDAPAPPAAAGPSGSGRTVGGVLGTPVKVLIAVVTVGVVGWGVNFASSIFMGDSSLFSWLARSGDGDLMAARAKADASEACGPRPSSPVAAVAPMMMPFGSDYMRNQAESLRHQIKARPQSCEAQQEPLRQLLMLGLMSEREEKRMWTRLFYLCGFQRWDMNYPGAPVSMSGECDDSDWCKAPNCISSFNEDCARAWATWPEGSCVRQEGRIALLTPTCARFIRGEATEAEVKELSPEAWCLSPEVLEERRALLKEKP